MHTDDMNKRVNAINSQIKAEIAKRDDNLKAVAERAGLNYGVVRRYIVGEREMPIRTFLALCAAIGVDPDDVITRAAEG